MFRFRLDPVLRLKERRRDRVRETLAEAVRTREPRLWTFASLMAQAPFQAVGFRVINFETVERAGEVLPRAEMEKVLE